MREPSIYDCFQVLLLQLADDGRGERLLGDSVSRARVAAEPFLVGEKLPDVYFEFPLAGDPFLDLTMLYGSIPSGLRVPCDAAAGTDEIFDWFASAHEEFDDISFGFELDTSKPQAGRAAIHFQPRTHIELVEPFFGLMGEPERAKLYLDLAARMPQGWPLSFFGLFRGRPGSPLRVCGYLDPGEKRACADDPGHLAAAFDELGFAAYDEAMLGQVRALMGAAPSGVDFQFDVYPDGRLGDTFAIDIQFGIEQPAAVCESFETGGASRVTRLLEDMGVADERWRLVPRAAFARALPVEGADGSSRLLSFTLMPQWLKTRWIGGTLQPAKMYCLGNSDYLDRE